jgi:hypothetical protein
MLLTSMNIDPSDEAEFNRWYDREHLEERVATPIARPKGRRLTAPPRLQQARRRVRVSGECQPSVNRFCELGRFPRAFGVVSVNSDFLAGQAMNRYRGTQAEFQFSMVAPHTAHSKLLISRASTICSLRS